jgi:hypothetical protein
MMGRLLLCDVVENGDGEKEEEEEEEATTRGIAIATAIIIIARRQWRLWWRRAALPTAAPHCLSFIRTFDGRSVVRDGSDGVTKIGYFGTYTRYLLTYHDIVTTFQNPPSWIIDFYRYITLGFPPHHLQWN